MPVESPVCEQISSEHKENLDSDVDGQAEHESAHTLSVKE